MYGREQRVLLRHYLERGLSKAEIARELGVARRTVHHWIATGQLERELDEAPVRYTARPPVERKVDPFRGILAARLLSSPGCRGASVRGGPRRRLRGWLHAGKGLCSRDATEAGAGPVVRFETPPGHQGQVDFAEFRLPWASATHCSSCWLTRGCCGCSSTRARRCSS